MMAANSNLIYLCIDRILLFTRKIQRPCHCQKTLDRIYETWTYIKKLPLLYRSYSYHIVERFPLDLGVSLHTLCPTVNLQFYKKGNTIYLNLDKRHYDIILEKEPIRNHLSKGVKHLIFKYMCQGPEMSSNENHLTLNTFISMCKSVKKVSFHKLYLIRWDSLQSFRSELLDCLSICSTIESLFASCSNIIITTNEIFCKYIFGFDYKKQYKSLFKTKNMDIHKLVSSWKPAWPQLKFYSCRKPQQTLLENLSLHVFKSLSSYEFNDSKIQLLFKYKFQWLTISKYNILTKARLEIECIAMGINLEDIDILQKLTDISDRQIRIRIFTDCNFGLTLKKIIKKNTDPLWLKYVSYANIVFHKNISSDNLQSLIYLICKATNLQTLFCTNIGTNIPENIVCQRKIPNLVIECCDDSFEKKVSNLIQLFPKTTKLVINLNHKMMNSTLTNLEMGAISDMTELKVILVTISIDGFCKLILTLALMTISQSIKKRSGSDEIKFVYAQLRPPYFCQDERNFLRLRGWNLHTVSNLKMEDHRESWWI